VIGSDKHTSLLTLATSIPFLPGLIFVGKVRSLPLEWSPVIGSTLVGFKPCPQILDWGEIEWK